MTEHEAGVLVCDTMRRPTVHASAAGAPSILEAEAKCCLIEQRQGNTNVYESHSNGQYPRSNRSSCRATAAEPQPSRRGAGWLLPGDRLLHFTTVVSGAFCPSGWCAYSRLSSF